MTVNEWNSSSSSLRLPYTTTSEIAYTIERLPLQLPAPDKGNGLQLSRSRVISMPLKGSQSHYTSSAPTTAMYASTSNPFYVPPPPSISSQHAKDISKMHHRSSSSPVVAEMAIPSRRRSSEISSASTSALSSKAKEVDEEEAIVSVESEQKRSLWNLRQRWRHPRLKTPVNTMPDDYFFPTTPPTPPTHTRMVARPSTSTSSSTQSPSFATKPNLTRPATSHTSAPTSSPPWTNSKRPLQPRNKTVPHLPPSIRHHSSKEIMPLQPPSFLSRTGITVAQEDDKSDEEREELEPYGWTKQATPRMYDDEEWRLHETYQWPSPIGSPHRYDRCIATSGWTQYQSDPQMGYFP